MNPINLDVISKKKRIILCEMALLEELGQLSITRQSPLLEQHALCHSMQNLISAVIDIAQHVATDAGREFNSYFESIEALGKIGILDLEFAADFAQVAKLRNVLVHLYDDINIELLFSLRRKLIDYSKVFLKSIEKLEP